MMMISNLERLGSLYLLVLNFFLFIFSLVSHVFILYFSNSNMGEFAKAAVIIGIILLFILVLLCRLFHKNGSLYKIATILFAFILFAFFQVLYRFYLLSFIGYILSLSLLPVLSRNIRYWIYSLFIGFSLIVIVYLLNIQIHPVSGFTLNMITKTMLDLSCALFISLILLHGLFFMRLTVASVQQEMRQMVHGLTRSNNDLIQKTEEFKQDIHSKNIQLSAVKNTVISIEYENEKLKKIMQSDETVRSNSRLLSIIYSIDGLVKNLYHLKDFKEEQGKINYSLKLFRKDKILVVTRFNESYRIVLTNILFNIFEILIMKLISDKNRLSGNIKERGSVNKLDLEKIIFDGLHGYNRLNSNISRIRRILKLNGLNPDLIQIKGDVIRLCTSSEELEIIDD